MYFYDNIYGLVYTASFLVPLHGTRRCRAQGTKVFIFTPGSWKFLSTTENIDEGILNVLRLIPQQIIGCIPLPIKCLSKARHKRFNISLECWMEV